MNNTSSPPIGEFSYNVMTEPWMSVVDQNNEIKFVGMRDYLVNAHLYIRSAENDEFPILRIMQERIAGAFVLDVFGSTEDDLKRMIEDGKFDENKIDSYIEDCEMKGVSFNLFDPQRPFLQTDRTTFEDIEKEIKLTSVATLNPRMASGNNPIFTDPPDINEYFENSELKDNRETYYDDVYDKKHPAESVRSMTFAEYINMLLIRHCMAGQGGSGYRKGLLANPTPPVMFHLTSPKCQNLFSSILMNTGFEEYEEEDEEHNKPMWLWDSYEFGKKTIAEGVEIPKKMGMFFPIMYIYPDLTSIDYSKGTMSRIYKKKMVFQDALFQNARESWATKHENSICIGIQKTKNTEKKYSVSEFMNSCLDMKMYSNIYGEDSLKALRFCRKSDALKEYFGQPFITAYYISMNQASYIKQGKYSCYLPVGILDKMSDYIVTLNKFLARVQGYKEALKIAIRTINKKIYRIKEPAKYHSSAERSFIQRYMAYCEWIFKNKFVPEIMQTKDTDNLNKLLEKYSEKLRSYLGRLLYQYPIPYGKSIDAHKEITNAWEEAKKNMKTEDTKNGCKE